MTAVDYPGNEDEAERLLEASETVSDRSSFLAAAADSKTKLSHLLDMGEKLSGETRETFMAVVGNLRGENIRNFVSVAFDSNENLDEFLKLTDELTGQEKDDFLKASVDAQEQRVLKEFIGLTNELTGPSRSLFLNVAETAGKQLGNLIQGTNNYISSQEKLFMANAKAQGFDLHNMFKSDKNDPTKVDSIAGIKSGYLPNFLENASASKHLVGSYLKSYIS